MDEGKNGMRRTLAKFRILTIVLCLVCLALLVALIVVSLHKSKTDGDNPQVVTGAKAQDDIIQGEPDKPSIFNDLTKTEVEGLMTYLHQKSNLSLAMPGEYLPLDSRFVYLAELYPPQKELAIAFLDKNGTRPPREAVVTLFIGDPNDQHISQIVIGPLPNPTYMKPLPGVPEKIPFMYRPYSNSEWGPLMFSIMPNFTAGFHDLLQKSFGGNLGFTNCMKGGKCLVLHIPVPVSPAVSGQNKRMMWLRMHQMVDSFILHPVGFAILVSYDSNGFAIEKVSYNSVLFDSIDQLVEAYNSARVEKINIPFPEESDQLFSKLETRGDTFPHDTRHEPIQIEPDGKRYSLKYQHVEYLGWRFDFRMSSIHGPAIYDIRFKNERIAYEISLEEIAVFYSGKQAPQMMTDSFDSSAFLGVSGKGMVPGIDCPSGATFIDASHVLEGSKEPVTYKNALCLFEFNTGMPLRRHHSYEAVYRSYYEGASSNVLVLRTVLTLLNYDYLVDFNFYQNGVMEVKATSTGYVLATFYRSDEAEYGTRIHENINANLHTHLFNFKVDLDIKGTKNRFKTLDILPKAVQNPIAISKQYHMTHFVHNVKHSELDGTYKFDFEKPKYLIFYNNAEKDKYDNPKSYRLLLKGMVKQLFAEGEGVEPSASWSRYQVAVTKVKDAERHSGSIFSFMDAANQMVNFQNFIDDNETIIDQDLVAWITLGLHHIPHTEDLPVTPSPGMGLSFLILSYNYYSEDPGMASKDAVRIEYKDPYDMTKGVNIKGAKQTSIQQCMTIGNPYWEMVKQSPSILLDTKPSI